MRRDERGVAFPSPLVLLSVVAVAMAGIAFLATNDDDGRDSVTTVSQPSPTPTATPTSTPSAAPSKPAKPKKPKKTWSREQVYVEVYNNSTVAGLAGATAAKASGAGWNVVGSDNWYGTIPEPTVYYPERLKDAGRALARDLGIARLQPAVDPMRLDRLTVIVTASYS